MLATAISLVLASSAASTGMTDSQGRAMTRNEIKEYNAKLARNDPAFIRCVRVLDPGTLVKKTTFCRTNAEWSRKDTVANQDARDTLERMQSGSWRTSDDPPPI